jgi:plastocyanin
MPTRPPHGAVLRLALIALLAGMVSLSPSLPVLARQDATPVAGHDDGATHESSAGLSVVASGLASPRGLAWDGSGALYVALAGVGGDTPGVGDDMGMSANGNMGGPSASVVKIVAGCGVPVARGLPSVFDGQAFKGVADVAFLGDDLYGLLEVGGAQTGNPGTKPGVVRIAPDGSTELIFDWPGWLEQNPPAVKSSDFDPYADPFALTTDGRQLVFGDARTGLVVGIGPDGSAEKIADLSADHPVLTGLATDRAGNIYATFLTQAPYVPGASRVDRIAPDGTVTTVWTGLTQATGVEVGADGTLYAIEMSAGNGIPPHTGRLVRQTGPGSLAEVVTGLNMPIGLRMSPDGALHISLPAIATSPAEGAVIRVDPAAAQPMQYDPSLLAANPCSGAATQGPVGTPGPGMSEPAAASGSIIQIASDLANPRGIAWIADGEMYVAQSGTGESATSTGTAAGVVRIDRGCAVPAGEGLPSSFDPYRDVMGTMDVAVLDGQLYAVVATTGALDDMDPARPNGIYRVEADGSTTLVVDLTTWFNANPVKDPPGDRNPRGEPYKMVPGNGFMWVVDSNSGEVLHVTMDGGVTRVADTSDQHLVVTALALAPGGGVYLGTLTPSPHTDGTAKVMLVGTDGRVTDVWTGLTTVTGVAVAPDGSLWAVEMATGNDTPDGMRPGTGRLVRQSSPDALEAVVSGFDFPIDLEIGPDGALYVAGPAYGGDDRSGWVVRIDPAIDAGTMLPADLLETGECGDSAAAAPAAAPAAPPAAATPEAAATTPAATATATEAAAAPADSAPAAGVNSVSIANYAFDPAAIEVAAGTTVTWTNNDTVPHTVTATDRSFDSGNLPPGATFSHTFTTAGTFDYICQYHASMRATVTVK